MGRAWGGGSSIFVVIVSMIMLVFSRSAVMCWSASWCESSLLVVSSSEQQMYIFPVVAGWFLGLDVCDFHAQLFNLWRQCCHDPVGDVLD